MVKKVIPIGFEKVNVSAHEKSEVANKKVVRKALDLSVENVGFKAGDVYQALASENKPLTVAEISKKANISKDETLLGVGWLYKEGKIKNLDGKLQLA